MQRDVADGVVVQLEGFLDQRLALLGVGFPALRCGNGVELVVGVVAVVVGADAAGAAIAAS